MAARPSTTVPVREEKRREEDPSRDGLGPVVGLSSGLHTVTRCGRLAFGVWPFPLRLRGGAGILSLSVHGARRMETAAGGTYTVYGEK